MRNSFKMVLSSLYSPVKSRLRGLAESQENSAVLLGQLLADRFRNGPTLSRLADAEFKVFSQFGEDGILQYLLTRVDTPDRTFFEIGVEDYYEANTRFLLLAKKWRGLVIEGNADQVRAICESNLAWRTSLTALAEFVTRDTINRIVADAGLGGDIGLFSIDIDGNDFWVWQALTATRPRIVICEFNRLYGYRLPLSIPYDPKFISSAAHPSRWYCGASLAGLDYLAQEKGYSLVGCTSEGVNAFFVRNDVMGSLIAVTPFECFAQVTPAPPGASSVAKDKLTAIGHLPLVNTSTGQSASIRDLIGSI